MIPYLGDYAEDATVLVWFNTFSSDDPSASVTVTNLAASDIKVYKDGSATFIATDGATVIIDHDDGDLGDGVQLLTIDTGADAAYSTGSDYMVRVEGITVDSGTLNAAIATFSIENRFNPSAALLALIQTDLDTLTADTVAILDDTDGLQLDLDTLTAGVTVTSIDASTLTAIEDEVWDAAQAGHVVANSMGVLASEIATIDGKADTIQAKTDDLTFTKALEVDVNQQSVNGVTIIGDGSGTKFNV